MTRTGAILTYLARQHPEANLLPNDIEAEARCFEWLNWLADNSTCGSLQSDRQTSTVCRKSYGVSAVITKGAKTLVRRSP
jgi:glutathione S-transferase